MRSFKRYQHEDYVIVVVFVRRNPRGKGVAYLIISQGFYTTLIAFMNIVAHLDTNLMLPEDIPLLTPDSIKSRIIRSKLLLVVEQSMIMTI